MSKRRVVVTGIGILSPIGIGIEQNWQNLTAGNSGISSISGFDTTGMPCSIAGQISDLDPATWQANTSLRKMDRFIQ